VCIAAEVNRICADPSFRSRIVGLLLEICSVDTAIGAEALREGERRVFRRITEELQTLSFREGRIVEQPIRPRIQGHPAYSLPYYTQSPQHPAGLPAAEAYRGRGNLLYFLDFPPTREGRSTAVNAHIDTVAPHRGPRIEGELMHGRGTADDKGNVAAAVGALLVLDRLAREKKIAPANRVTAMFVIDEEIGGNGSLDLALDRELKERYDSLLILECTGNRIHPANRGAVYFRCELRGSAGLPLTEAIVHPILSMEREGGEIRRESDHPLFPHRPVQTCNGILGPFGVHPSSICGEVRFAIRGPDTGRDSGPVRAALESGLADYIARYGDKSGKKFERHYTWAAAGASEAVVTVHGSTGHMGSLPDNDAAITKWAYLAASLLELKHARPLPFTLELLGTDGRESLVLEGAQGFLPTHPMAEVKRRMSAAFQRGLERYALLSGRGTDGLAGTISFDKLHNDAFACDPLSPSMLAAREAAVLAGAMAEDEQLLGWNVSCDARLFAGEHPGLPVITCGAGRLEHAHSEGELLRLPELFQAVALTALFLVLETGSYAR
jgi:acetylornithine deacetylase/succinyl-diaminopimelate desuccinylase-like protein